VTDETRIYERQDDKQVATTFEDLKVGQQVEATYAGAVAESYPSQGEAESIVILEESSGNDDPRCLLPEGCDTGGEVVATAVVERAEATSYQYGTHALIDGDTGETIYALTSESVDLDAYEGELVTIYGTYVPGYEKGVDGGPPLVEVYWVETASDGGKETVTVYFELTVEGEPPAGTTFFGEAGLGTRGESVQFTDPDSDGVYTGSLKVKQGTQRGAWIEQGTGRVIKDFGLVTFDEDKTFSSSISFKDAGSGDGGSGSSGGSGGGKNGGTKAKELPKTGGAVPTALGAGALLASSGFLLRRLCR
jgi:LPXTG-motif cell wall-anchored protein